MTAPDHAVIFLRPFEGVDDRPDAEPRDPESPVAAFRAEIARRELLREMFNPHRNELYLRFADAAQSLVEALESRDEDAIRRLQTDTSILERQLYGTVSATTDLANAMRRSET